MLRGVGLGSLFGGGKGGAPADAKPSLAEQNQAISANLNPMQFGG